MWLHYSSAPGHMLFISHFLYKRKYFTGVKDRNLMKRNCFCYPAVTTLLSILYYIALYLVFCECCTMCGGNAARTGGDVTSDGAGEHSTGHGSAAWTRQVQTAQQRLQRCTTGLYRVCVCVFCFLILNEPLDPFPFLGGCWIKRRPGLRLTYR